MVKERGIKKRSVVQLSFVFFCFPGTAGNSQCEGDGSCRLQVDDILNCKRSRRKKNQCRRERTGWEKNKRRSKPKETRVFHRNPERFPHTCRCHCPPRLGFESGWLRPHSNGCSCCRFSLLLGFPRIVSSVPFTRADLIWALPSFTEFFWKSRLFLLPATFFLAYFTRFYPVLKLYL